MNWFPQISHVNLTFSCFCSSSISLALLWFKSLSAISPCPLSLRGSVLLSNSCFSTPFSPAFDETNLQWRCSSQNRLDLPEETYVPFKAWLELSTLTSQKLKTSISTTTHILLFALGVVPVWSFKLQAFMKHLWQARNWEPVVVAITETGISPTTDSEEGSRNAIEGMDRLIGGYRVLSTGCAACSEPGDVNSVSWPMRLEDALANIVETLDDEEVVDDELRKELLHPGPTGPRFELLVDKGHVLGSRALAGSPA